MKAPSLEHFVADSRTAACTFRHLLRALLREATYLPDPAARSYYRSHILRSFRAQRENNVTPKRAVIREYEEVSGLQAPKGRVEGVRYPKQFVGEDSIHGKERQLKLFLRGRNELRLLARANLGHTSALMKVLLSTYGRIGKRRWELLRPYTVPEPPSDAEGVRAQLSSDDQPYDVDSLANLPPKLKALVENQISSRLPERRSAFQRGPDLTQKNIWQRRLSARRRKNVILAWRLKLESKLYPPLPDVERKRLREIASREASHGVGFRARRSRRMPHADDTPTVALDLIKDELSESILKTQDSHRLTTRFMSRCLRSVYNIIPVLELNNNVWTASFPGIEPKWRRVHEEKSTPRSVLLPDVRQQASSGSHWMFSEEPLDGREADVEPIGAKSYRHNIGYGKRS